MKKKVYLDLCGQQTICVLIPVYMCVCVGGVIKTQVHLPPTQASWIKISSGEV